LARRSTDQLLAPDAGGVAMGAAPEEPVEPVLPLDGLLMGEEEDPGVVAVSVFLPQAPSASAAVRASAATATAPNLLSCMSISFQEWKRDRVLVSETPIYLPGGLSP
jgi:hypothetical protein